MPPSGLNALTTGEWIVAVGSGLLLLLSLVPVGLARLALRPDQRRRVRGYPTIHAPV